MVANTLLLDHAGYLPVFAHLTEGKSHRYRQKGQGLLGTVVFSPPLFQLSQKFFHRNIEQFSRLQCHSFADRSVSPLHG